MSGLELLLKAANTPVSVTPTGDYESTSRAEHNVKDIGILTNKNNSVNKIRIARTIAKVFSASCNEFILTDPVFAERVIDKLLKKQEMRDITIYKNQDVLVGEYLLEEALKWTATYVAYGEKMYISPCVIVDQKNGGSRIASHGMETTIWNGFINRGMKYFDETLVPGLDIVTVGNEVWEVSMEE